MFIRITLQQRDKMKRIGRKPGNMLKSGRGESFGLCTFPDKNSCFASRQWTKPQHLHLLDNL